MNDTNIEGLRAFVLERRKALNLSQKQVGEGIAVSRRTYQRKEDTMEFTLVEFAKLAKVLKFRIQLSNVFTFV